MWFRIVTLVDCTDVMEDNAHRLGKNCDVVSNVWKNNVMVDVGD